MIFFKNFKVKSLTKKIKAMQHYRSHNQPTEEQLAKERSLYHQLAALYIKLSKHKKFPFAREMYWECLRTSAKIEDIDAQFKLAKSSLDEAKFRESLEIGAVFSSPINDQQMRRLYNEALAYLIAAETLGSVEAKRLRGLCYINGWGVETDCDQGFELVVASIDQEKSWDKLPQIFATIGLNKTEFFTALMKHRHKS